MYNALNFSDSSYDFSDSFRGGGRKVKKFNRYKQRSGLSVMSRQEAVFPQECSQLKSHLEYSNKSFRFEDFTFRQFVVREM